MKSLMQLIKLSFIIIIGMFFLVATGPTDTVKPIITLKGDNPLILVKYETFKDPGATANDNKDGNITSKIVVKGKVDTSKVGTYSLTYEVSDKAGNLASKTRTVIVKNANSSSNTNIIYLKDTTFKINESTSESYYYDIGQINIQNNKNCKIYSFQKYGDDSEQFTITMKGYIKSRLPLNYDVKHEYNFKVSAYYYCKDSKDKYTNKANIKVIVVPTKKVDYTLHVKCANYTTLSSNYLKINPNFSSQAISINGDIENNYNDIIDYLNSIKYQLGYIQDISQKKYILFSGGDRNLLKENYQILEDNNDNYVNVKCIYRNTLEEFSEIAYLSDKKLWKKDKVFHNYGKVFNDNIFYINYYTDLYSKIFRKNIQYYNDYSIAKDLTNNFFKYNLSFIDSFSLIENKDFKPLWSENKILYNKENNNKSLFNLNNILFQETSLYFTNGKVSLLNNLIANEYEKVFLNSESCSNQDICSLFFNKYVYILTNNYDFKYNLQFWNFLNYGKIDNYKEDFYYTTSGNIFRQKILFNNKDKETMPVVDIYQRSKIDNINELNKLIFKVKSLKMFGGSNNTLFGGYTNSGIAGYYLCFDDINKNHLGCIMLENHTDRLTIKGVYIAEHFKLKDSKKIKYLQRNNGPINYAMTLNKIINKNLSFINKKQIKYVTYGTYLSGISSNKNRCNECTAQLETEYIGLFRYKK